jgi:hypothetical protein
LSAQVRQYLTDIFIVIEGKAIIEKQTPIPTLADVVPYFFYYCHIQRVNI